VSSREKGVTLKTLKSDILSAGFEHTPGLLYLKTLFYDNMKNFIFV
jgi:hypothetical protein